MKIRRSMLERVFREELKNILAEKALLSEALPDTETGLYPEEAEEEYEETLPGMSNIEPEDDEFTQIQQDIETNWEPISTDVDGREFVATSGDDIGAIAKATGQESIKPLDVDTMKADFEADLPALSEFETAGDRQALLGRFDSYVSPGGNNRKAWIRRLTDHVFAEGTDPKLIEAHYDNVMMPSILVSLKAPIVKGEGDLLGYLKPEKLASMRKDGISDDEIRTRVRDELDKMPVGTTANQGAFMDETGEIITQGATPQQWEKGKVARHERGHALSKVETFGEGGSESEMLKYYQEKGMIRDDFDVASLDQDQTQSAQHRESFDAIFKSDLPRFAGEDGHEAQEEFYTSITDGIEKVGGEWSGDNVLALLTGTGPFKYGDQGNDMKEFIRAFTPSFGMTGNPGVLRDDHQLAVDNFYNAAAAIQERVSGNPIAGDMIGSPRVYANVMKSKTFRDELMDSEAGKAFTEMLNTLSEEFNTFAALDIGGEMDPGAIETMGMPGAGAYAAQLPTSVAESKKKGSDMNALFEGWRRFIE